jgi:uncharacterized alpha-E superfamily protein
MLSRVAESLFWLARYIERAEDITRLLAVNFNVLLDTSALNTPEGWGPLIAMNGDEALFYEIYGIANAPSVIDFLLWHPLNPNGVTACITRARENARAVREQISSEMWEHLNRLYLLTREVNRDDVQRSPQEFFQKVRDGSQMFQGVTLATMTHDEPYEFLRLGTHLERADKTVRILDAKYMEVAGLPDGSAESSLQLIALLRSCSAFEPFRRAQTQGLALQTDRVAEYLLLSREFPRAVLFCVQRCQQSLDTIGEPEGPAKAEHPRRVLGRLQADLEYLNPAEVLGHRMGPFLDHLLNRLNAVGDSVARTYFSTSVILPDDRPRQQQQQQQ